MNQSESILLKTIFESDNEKALSYYSQWCQLVDFDALEGGSFRLIPSLYRRMSIVRSDLLHFNRMKGIFRYFLYKNACLSRALSSLISLLDSAGLPFIVLKGSALIIAYYDEPALRPMNDIDILIHTKDVQEVLGIFMDNGWSHNKTTPIETIIKSTNTITLRDQNNLELDIHWQVIYQSCWEGAEISFWENTEIASLNDQSVTILTPTLTLLHTIAHGLRWNEMSSIRWIQDSKIILDKRYDEIDWEKLIEESQKLRLLYTLKIGITRLIKEFDFSFPESFLNQLASIPDHPTEKKLHEALNAPSKINYFKSKWYIYSIGCKSKSFIKRLLGFPHYLKKLWNLSSYWAVFGLFFRKIYSHLAGKYKK